MGMSLYRKNMLVIVTRGRMTSTKAVILAVEPTRLVIAGLYKKKVYIKKMNPMHVLATSYEIDIPEVAQGEKKEMIKNVSGLFEQTRGPGMEWMKTKLLLKN